MTIPLHPTEGIRPVLTKCPRCGGDSGEIALVGNARLYECEECGRKELAYRKPGPCPACKSRRWHSKQYDGTPVYGGMCASCQAEDAEHAAVVASGGVYFHCDKCGVEGVIKPEAPVCAEVRNALNIQAPEPCGLTVHGCHMCEPESGGSSEESVAGETGSAGSSGDMGGTGDKTTPS